LSAPASGDGPALRAGASAQVFVADPAAPVLDDEDAHHLTRVLRLRPGEVVVAADGAGRWARCRLRAGTDPTALLEPEEAPAFEPAFAPALTVAFAPAKGDRPEWVVQKLSELGIDRLVPIVTARSVVRWEGERAVRAHARLERVAKEAAAQSRRVWLPEVAPVTSLGDLVAEAPGGCEVRLAQPGGGPPRAGDTAVAVGPEGGWDAAEAQLGGSPLGLGPTILRSETAALAAAVLLVSLRATTVRESD
jgi:16S rRNA (uracil1498-N3)-methyltransferase